jgi:hypothetical protein
MNEGVILVVGAGRCGLLSMVHLLNQQPGVAMSLREPPILPWRPPASGCDLDARFRRMQRDRRRPLVGDAAPYYLNYLESILSQNPAVRVLGLTRPIHEVVGSYCRWFDELFPLPMNHWAMEPTPGWHHDPIWTQSFPQYDTTDRQQGLTRYCEEYHAALADLADRFPQAVRLYDASAVLNQEATLGEALEFVGIPPDQQVRSGVGTRLSPTKAPPPRPQAHRTSNHPMDPGRCVVLVPFTGSILPQCERALQELERRGYHVRRVGGYAAIDQGRNQMATDALIDGFEETMWIDSDIEFHPDAVDQLRALALPIVCGIYPQKGKRALACHIVPGTPQMVFGKGGGVVELLYAGTGFLLVRREVYLKIQHHLELPITNERFGVPMLPYFHPMLHPIEDGHWYLAEDYAFCQRARASGFFVHADTRIRLWHIGSYSYGWEDAGMDRERTGTFTLHFPDQAPQAQQERAL